MKNHAFSRLLALVLLLASGQVSAEWNNNQSITGMTNTELLAVINNLLQNASEGELNLNLKFKKNLPTTTRINRLRPRIVSATEIDYHLNYTRRMKVIPAVRPFSQARPYFSLYPPAPGYPLAVNYPLYLQP